MVLIFPWEIEARSRTELRKTFGDTLREEITNNPSIYDRIQLIKSTLPKLKETTKKVLENISQFSH